MWTRASMWTRSRRSMWTRSRRSMWVRSVDNVVAGAAGLDTSARHLFFADGLLHCLEVAEAPGDRLLDQRGHVEADSPCEDASLEAPVEIEAAGDGLLPRCEEVVVGEGESRGDLGHVVHLDLVH